MGLMFSKKNTYKYTQIPQYGHCSKVNDMLNLVRKMKNQLDSDNIEENRKMLLLENISKLEKVCLTIIDEGPDDDLISDMNKLIHKLKIGIN